MIFLRIYSDLNKTSPNCSLPDTLAGTPPTTRAAPAPAAATALAPIANCPPGGPISFQHEAGSSQHVTTPKSSRAASPALGAQIGKTATSGKSAADIKTAVEVHVEAPVTPVGSKAAKGADPTANGVCLPGGEIVKMKVNLKVC